jgi:hypothetical protein
MGNDHPIIGLPASCEAGRVFCLDVPLDSLIEDCPLNQALAFNIYLNICGLAAVEFELALKRLDKDT